MTPPRPSSPPGRRAGALAAAPPRRRRTARLPFGDAAAIQSGTNAGRDRPPGTAGGNARAGRRRVLRAPEAADPFDRVRAGPSGTFRAGARPSGSCHTGTCRPAGRCPGLTVVACPAPSTPRTPTAASRPGTSAAPSRRWCGSWRRERSATRGRPCWMPAAAPASTALLLAGRGHLVTGVDARRGGDPPGAREGRRTDAGPAAGLPRPRRPRPAGARKDLRHRPRCRALPHVLRRGPTSLRRQPGGRGSPRRVRVHPLLERPQPVRLRAPPGLAPRDPDTPSGPRRDGASERIDAEELDTRLPAGRIEAWLVRLARRA